MSFVRDDPSLFNEGDLAIVLMQAEAALKQEIETYDDQKITSASADDLVEAIVEKFQVEPLTLRENETTTEQKQTALETRRIPDGRFLYGDHQPTISASAISFFVPFEGDRQLFRLRPSTFTLSPPRAAIRGNDVIFTFTTHALDAAEIKREFENQLRQVQSNVAAQRSNIDAFNVAIRTSAQARIDARKERVIQGQRAVEAIGFPTRKTDGVAPTHTANVKRKIVPTRSPGNGVSAKSEPILAMEEYEHILNVLQNMTAVVERGPASAFAGMGEEDIRHHFLVQLNGQYDGAATGETFNGNGKTDILLRDDGKNIFIAECKFWRGLATFGETIDQLLGYASWRDTKTAIVIFNRGTKLSTVLEKIPEGLRTHANFKSMGAVSGETRFRAIFRHRNDPDRELIVTVLVFDIPK